MKVRTELKASARPARMYIRSPEGIYEVAKPDEVVAAALSLLRPGARLTESLTAPSASRAYFTMALHGIEHECFCAAWCDNQHRVIAFDILATGTIDSATIHAREIVKRALELNASRVIFAHNHPFGSSTPSPHDVSLTNHLKQALGLVDVGVLDHFVIGDGQNVSFAETGRL